MTAPDEILDEIAWFGLVAVINAPFSGADFIEISDALLAAPLPLVAIAAGTPDAGDIIASLRARHGANLRVGASHVTTLAALEAVGDAGAQFVLGGPPDAAMVTAARRAGVAYVPHCATSHDVAAARALGCAMLLRVLPGAGAAPVPADWPTADGPPVLVAGAVTADNIAAIAQGPAAAVALGYAPLAAGQWSAAALITQARRMRAAWEAARLGSAGTSRKGSTEH